MPKISLLSCWYNWKYCLWKKKCVLDEKAQRMSVKSNENKRQSNTKQPRTKSWTIFSHFKYQQSLPFIELSHLWNFSKVIEFLVWALLKILWNAFYSLSTKHRRFVNFFRLTVKCYIDNTISWKFEALWFQWRSVGQTEGGARNFIKQRLQLKGSYFTSAFYLHKKKYWTHTPLDFSKVNDENDTRNKWSTWFIVVTRDVQDTWWKDKFSNK
jgi:hypothetical protein